MWKGRLKSVNGMIFYVESPTRLTKKLKYMGRENISKTSLPSQTSVNAIPTEIPAKGLVSNSNDAHNFHHISQRSADLTDCPIQLVNKMVWNWSRHDQWDGENRRSPSSSHVTDSKGRKACGHTVTWRRPVLKTSSRWHCTSHKTTQNRSRWHLNSLDGYIYGSSCNTKGRAQESTY